MAQTRPFNIYGRDCYGKRWFRGQVYATNATEALTFHARHGCRPSIGGDIAE